MACAAARLRVGEIGPRAWAGLGTRQAPLGDRHLDQRAGLDQAVDDAGRASGFRGQRHLGAHQPVGGDLERALAGRRHARRLAARPSLHVTPKRGLPGSNTAGGPIIMRTTMPSGASV